MFREERLTGFKVGKAWRTTETDLKADIARMRQAPQNETGLSKPPAAQTPALQTDVTADEAATPRAPEPAGTGRLLIFSPVSGQPVYLDGERRGITTLSILDVPQGPHRLRVGEREEVIKVLTDVEHRVTAKEDGFQVRERFLNAAVTRTQVQIVIENASRLSGKFSVRLRDAAPGSDGNMFCEYAAASAEKGLFLSGPLAKEGPCTCFDGALRTTPGSLLQVEVPRQHGIEKEVRDNIPLDMPRRVIITLTDGGLLRSRPAIRIRSEALT